MGIRVGPDAVRRTNTSTGDSSTVNTKKQLTQTVWGAERGLQLGWGGQQRLPEAAVESLSRS